MPRSVPGARPRTPLLRAAAVLVTAAALAGCAGGVDQGTGDADNRYVEGDGSSTAFAVDERQEAPEVAGETLEGEPVSLADYRGDVLVLNFWASWCAPCRAETPVLEQVYEEHREAGLEFLGVNIKDNLTAAQAFERNNEVSYPSLYDQPGQVSQAFRDTVPPQSIPSTLVIDREGRIAARVIGATNYNGLTELVEPVLAEDGGDAGSP
ncbi:TlpA family protein disulfide reductase [Marinitenerispora sediminis]|uniref:Oxidoreductase n=1 Tax=Marinitenerispora sediminis TaxID=1931232 RepID=A0A368T0T6_9ACTN|nr:TlpA disulfide reductase family protein [Marinitenerispora sediminis]RCV49976.1 oxidoreductase [Marinitenerispora sediminis]RCV50214.1 oxidoreductase [Marinitenerispora sediminis]RCV53428.1 oxidoreductase [Marinitenerispora sediminis]